MDASVGKFGTVFSETEALLTACSYVEEPSEETLNDLDRILEGFGGEELAQLLQASRLLTIRTMNALEGHDQDA